MRLINVWHLDGTPGSAVTLLHAGPWGVPGHRSGLPWLPGRGHCDQHTACSRMAGPRGLPAPPGSLASPRRVGGRLGRRAGLADPGQPPAPHPALWRRRKPWGLGWSPSIATHRGDLGQTSLLPPSLSRIRTPGGGHAGPNEGLRLSPLQHDISGWQSLLLCSCLRSHPSSCAPGRTTPAPPPPTPRSGEPIPAPPAEPGSSLPRLTPSCRIEGRVSTPLPSCLSSRGSYCLCPGLCLCHPKQLSTSREFLKFLKFRIKGEGNGSPLQSHGQRDSPWGQDCWTNSPRVFWPQAPSGAVPTQQWSGAVSEGPAPPRRRPMDP